MGKKATKKARAPTKEIRSTSLSKKVSEQPNQSEEGAVTEVKEKQACVHFDKGLHLDKVLDKIKSSRQIKCEECKEGVHSKRGTKAKSNKGKKSSSEPKAEKKAIWVCLECGVYVCGGVGLPTGSQSHVVRHIRLTRHRLVIQWENPLLRWCFSCNSLLPVEKEENGEKIDSLLVVVKSIKERSLKTSSDTEEQCSGSGSVISDMKLEGSVSVTSGIEVRDGYVVRGLVNLGNTCFFNSIMQSLLSLDQLRDHFLKEDVVSGGPLASSLKKLFAETKPEAGSKSVVNPRAFFGSFCARAPQFRGYDQHDSHELLRCLLDSLSSEESALRKRRGGDEKESTLIESVFGGETSSIVSCIECGHSSKVFEPFLDLSLPIPFKKTPPPKKLQTVSRAKKAKLPPKRVPKGGSKLSKLSKTVSTKALSESPGKAVVATAESDTANGSVLETPSVIENKPESESVTQSDTVFDNFWLDIGPETSGDETNLDTQENIVIDNQSLENNTEKLMQDYGGCEKADEKEVQATQSDEFTATSGVSVEINEASCVNGDKVPTAETNGIVPDPDQTLESNTEKLKQDNGGCEKAETILDEKEVQADECTATSGISVEINQASCVNGDNSGLGECSSSSVNPCEEEEVPLVVTDSQVLYMPYNAVAESEGEEASSSFVDLGGLFDEPEVSTEGPVFGPPSKAEASSSSSGVGLIAFSSESDPEELDDSDSPVSVERCLSHFTKPEILSDDNAWDCENCAKKLKLQQLREKGKAKKDESRLSNGCVENGVSGEQAMSSSNSGNDSESEDEEEDEDSVKLVTVKRDATKRVLINKAPPVLTIHLKRFSQDTRGRLSKLSGHVTFKEFIDLRQYMDSRRSGEEDLPVYRLAGLVEHSGTMRGGHYVAYVRGGQRVKGTESSTVWYNVSDAYVRQVSLEKVLHSEAYILFYERISSAAAQD